MRIVFDIGYDRLTYEGTDEPPPMGASIRIPGAGTHPKFNGVVTAILPTEDGYLVTVSPRRAYRKALS